MSRFAAYVSPSSSPRSRVLAPAAARAASLRDTSPGRPRPSASRAARPSTRWPTPSRLTSANNLPVISASAGFTYRYNPHARGLRAQRRDPRPDLPRAARHARTGQVQRQPQLAVRRVQRVRRPRACATCRATARSCCATSTPPATCSASRPTGCSTASGCATTSSPSASPTASSTTSTSTCSCRSSPRPSTSASRASRSRPPDPTASSRPTPGRRGTASPTATPFGAGDLLLRLKYQLPRADWFRSARRPAVALPHRPRGRLPGHRRLLDHARLLRLDAALGSRRAVRQRRASTSTPRTRRRARRATAPASTST